MTDKEIANDLRKTLSEAMELVESQKQTIRELKKLHDLYQRRAKDSDDMVKAIHTQAKEHNCPKCAGIDLAIRTYLATRE